MSKPVSGRATSITSVPPSGAQEAGRASSTASSKLASTSDAPVPSFALDRSSRSPSRLAVNATCRPS